MNKEVNLTKRVKTAQGPRFCPVVISANGRVKPDYVFIGGKEERHPEGAYYLEWYQGGKRVRQSVGKDASTAAAPTPTTAASPRQQSRRPQTRRRGHRRWRPAGGCGCGYLEDIKITKKPKTYAAYSTALEYFLESCNKQRAQRSTAKTCSVSQPSCAT